MANVRINAVGDQCPVPVVKATKALKEFREAGTLEVQVDNEIAIQNLTPRCLGCGASIVDANRCIGCGLCTTRCEFDAIHLRRDNPACSTMVRSEDKMKAILPHAAKRGIKLLLKGKKKAQ